MYVQADLVGGKIYVELGPVCFIIVSFFIFLVTFGGISCLHGSVLSGIGEAESPWKSWGWQLAIWELLVESGIPLPLALLDVLLATSILGCDHE